MVAPDQAATRVATVAGSLIEILLAGVQRRCQPKSRPCATARGPAGHPGGSRDPPVHGPHRAASRSWAVPCPAAPAVARHGLRALPPPLEAPPVPREASSPSLPAPRDSRCHGKPVDPDRVVNSSRASSATPVVVGRESSPWAARAVTLMLRFRHIISKTCHSTTLNPTGHGGREVRLLQWVGLGQQCVRAESRSEPGWRPGAR